MKTMSPEYIDWLGREAIEALTGATGTITSISYDLTGCIQAFIDPCRVLESGEKAQGSWFDTDRIRISTAARAKLPGEERGTPVDNGPSAPHPPTT